MYSNDQKWENASCCAVKAKEFLGYQGRSVKLRDAPRCDEAQGLSNGKTEDVIVYAMMRRDEDNRVWKNIRRCATKLLLLSLRYQP